MEDDLRLDPYSQEEGSEILEDLLNNFNRIGENQGGDDEQEAEDQEIDILELLSSYGRSSFSSALPSTSSASQLSPMASRPASSFMECTAYDFLIEDLQDASHPHDLVFFVFFLSLGFYSLKNSQSGFFLWD